MRFILILFATAFAEEAEEDGFVAYSQFEPSISSSSARLSFHGGDVILNAHVYPITMGSISIDRVIQYTNALKSSSFLGLAAQYIGVTPPLFIYTPFTSFLGLELGCLDENTGNPTGTSSTSLSDIKNYICGLRSPNHFDIYAWFTTERRNTNCDVCGWHSTVVCSGITVVVLYIFNVENDNGCSIPSTIDSATNIFSHELFECITDPEADAWFDDNTGEEVSDICSFNFGSTPLVLDGVVYNVQQEWSNQDDACSFGNQIVEIVLASSANMPRQDVFLYFMCFFIALLILK